LRGVERDNLLFEVQTSAGAGKLERVHHLLSHRLPEGLLKSMSFEPPRKTRRSPLNSSVRMVASRSFPRRLTPPEKKRTQDAFLAGETRIICATNAFGMASTKRRPLSSTPTHRLPGELLAGSGTRRRDGRKAECVLLYADERLRAAVPDEAFSELSRRDIAQILRSLRKAAPG